MLKSKQIKALEKRLSALETELKTVLSALSCQEPPSSNKISYEEVINEWLCGKNQG